ncbi:uncharacterized protein UV8b_02846 [Ustilaginoidea virens]|uniref:TM7S3/TM198-like domain-containing protein n=2 Tax=Ustilaginoidea virens TaxID=1159556 RepID=A0A8E5HNA0_USTVR|nr:uncharacterized protein UV8b_02846 [Ustilaginoidea virens]QUC18605.1 hypothetical protein UV8b_02846 [Ustilaginoidea virens]
MTTTAGFGDNSTLFNSTIPAGQLPLPPQLTPGWGVAGVIMLATGVIYTLVGIKNRWIHTFFSTAYVTVLGVAVLIIYVMSTPVSNALQGGYVAAAVMSGCAVGAAALFFKELTEGFGCALGGFCISMWLLCLVPGGLLRTTPSKPIFVASLTVVGLAFYFSRLTRDWALIVLIAFGGSTITVLGIDCFSQAGLKEFWAYLWGMNDNLFPLGADTYPVTKGIRVETAAIVIISLVGIISQIKLWRIVREKRAKRAAERAEEQRNLEHEEETVGRQIEEVNARERQQWERVYGDGAAESIADSRFTDTGSEKRLRPSLAESKRQLSAEAVELTDMSESDHSRNGPEALMAAEVNEEGKVTVRVAAEDVPESAMGVQEAATPDEKDEARQGAQVSSDDGKRHSKSTVASKRASQAQIVPEAPELVPLPFIVPEETDAKSEADRSSIATFADEAEVDATSAPRKYQSLVKRLSLGPASFLHNISQRSDRTEGAVADGLSDSGKSTEELFLERTRWPEDDERSLAATIDEESVSSKGHNPIDEDHETDEDTGKGEPATPRLEIQAKLGQPDNEPPVEGAEAAGAIPASRPTSSTRTPGPTVIVGEPAGHDTTPNAEQLSQAQAEGQGKRDSPADPNLPAASDRAESVASNSSTAPASLTKDRLPRSLSRVAMSYRTNEWAKHLSNAERPELDELHIPRARAAPKTARDTKEKAAPVDVEALRRTAEDGVPPFLVRRSTSQTSDLAMSSSSTRRSPRPDLPAATTAVVPPASPTEQNPRLEQRAAQSAIARPASSLRKKSSGFKQASPNFTSIAEERANGPTDEPIAEEGSSETPQPDSSHSSTVALDKMSSQPPATMAAAEKPSTPGIVSYSSPQTLMGQREIFIRSKSQGNLFSNTAEPTLASQGLGSESGSLRNYALHAATMPSVADPDDVPLSQRKEMMRHNGLMLVSGSPSQPAPVPTRRPTGADSSENLAFNSHQPKRSSTRPTLAAREAQLASFRQSVQHGLRSGTPVMMNTGRDSPFGSPPLLGGGREAEMQRNMEMQRTVLMGQKEAEAQRREVQKKEKEDADRAFDERMRNGDMLEIHREAMRKMQKHAR